MILYFSATGNSEYAARYLAELLGDTEVHSLNTYMQSGTCPQFISEKPYVIVSPVYISSIPGAVLKLLTESSFSGNKKVYFVMTCAGDRSASGYSGYAFCRKKELKYMGTAHLSMPQDYLIYFKTKSPEENNEKLMRGIRPVPGLAKAILDGRRFEEKKPGRLHIMIVKPVDALFRKFFIKPEKFYANGHCISCGLCQKVCPLGNIRLEDGKPAWGDNCIHCTACINRCPQNAIEYGKLTQGKPRYKAPAYHGKSAQNQEK